ncbi:MAG: hypothetical protein HOC74_13780 [Gemmatimonadetes bacterium]|nr:hypothetical protein [Gemmatimonadota bacterium]
MTTKSDRVTDMDERISRIIEHWTLPEAYQVVDHVRRARIQLVQAGNFGMEFYSLAGDGDIERSWAGMPLLGAKANLERAAEVIPQIQEEGARVVGQLSTTMHFGNHEEGLGLFGEAWGRMWTDDLLGPPPCAGVAEVTQRNLDGSLEWRTIEGRPYRTYRGCMCNPQLLEVLKAMVRKGIDIGLDGFNATHHYESFCHCHHCREYVSSYLRARLKEEELQRIFGTADLEQVADLLSAGPGSSEELRARLELVLSQGAALRRKESFDAVFTEYGRSLKPGLLLAQWNHKYDFRPHDERSLLPTALWARGEDYIWYSQGPSKGASSLAQGYLADMGLPSRFMYAAGGGRPFVINKYDYRRWRIWAAEAAAHHGTALAFHAGPPRLEQEETVNVAPEDYYAPVIRYQRFMAAHEELLHPATPWSQIALVYPKRAEMQAEMDCLDALKRLGQHLEDGHWFFDIILDEQLIECAGDYDALILPEVERLSAEEGERLQAFVRAGGFLAFTGNSGCRDVDGSRHEEPLLQAWRVEPTEGLSGNFAESGSGGEGGMHIPDGPWSPEMVPIKGIRAEMPVYPKLENDAFGQQFLKELEQFFGRSRLVTDAPWFVRVRAWRPQTVDALVIHWINYQQDEEAAIEIPIPIGPLRAEVEVPDGFQVERVEWHYPEMREPLVLEHQTSEGNVSFAIPRLIVYGMSILYLRGV